MLNMRVQRELKRKGRKGEKEKNLSYRLEVVREGIEKKRRENMTVWGDE